MPFSPDFFEKAEKEKLAQQGRTADLLAALHKVFGGKTPTRRKPNIWESGFQKPEPKAGGLDLFPKKRSKINLRLKDKIKKSKTKGGLTFLDKLANRRDFFEKNFERPAEGGGSKKKGLRTISRSAGDAVASFRTKKPEDAV